MDYLHLRPIYQERVWGGRDLEEVLGRNLPEGKTIGESWEIVDREEANSEIYSTSERGQTLGQLRRDDPEGLMGPGWSSNRPFPLLVKWLDCQERLSLQVHPPSAVAPELGGEPKTENWYIVRARKGAALLAGLKPGVTQDAFEKALKEEALEELICRLPSEAGDSLFVPSGRIHAIDGGNLILEIQQNSDTTYRVYDWGRVGLDGKPRELHVEASLKSIDFNDFEPELIKNGGEAEAELASSREFRLRRKNLAAGQSLTFDPGIEPKILSIVAGSLTETKRGDQFGAGTNLLLPFSGRSSWVADVETTILITDRFNN